jgi:hypothetical protein
MSKTFSLIRFIAVLALMCIVIACSTPAKAQTPDESKIALNYKIGTDGLAAPILAYTPWKIDGLFGTKLDFQAWMFGGADPASGNALGGGALVLHTPVAKNLWLNVGIDCTFKDSSRPVFAGVIGFEILRL